MTKRLAILALTLIALCFAIAACGDDDDDDDKAKDSGNTPAETSGGEANTEADTGAADEGGNDGAAPAASVKQAVDNCKKSINAQPQLSADVKKDLEEVCEEAGSGDEDGVRKASKEVCRRIVEETAPAGAAREQALAACDQATAPGSKGRSGGSAG